MANFLQQSGSPGKNVTPLKNTSLETSSVFHCREKIGKQIFGTTSFLFLFVATLKKIRIFFFGCWRCFDCNKFFTSDVVRSCSISGEVRACVMSDPNQCFSYQERGVGAIEGVVIMVWVKKEQRNAFLNAFRWMCESTQLQLQVWETSSALFYVITLDGSGGCLRLAWEPHIQHIILNEAATGCLRLIALIYLPYKLS